MNYKGKLYGKISRSYFSLKVTSDDFEALEKEVEKLQKKLTIATTALHQIARHGDFSDIKALDAIIEIGKCE